jgi:hypothetical protein
MTRHEHYGNYSMGMYGVRRTEYIFVITPYRRCGPAVTLIDYPTLPSWAEGPLLPGIQQRTLDTSR